MNRRIRKRSRRWKESEFETKPKKPILKIDLNFKGDTYKNQLKEIFENMNEAKHESITVSITFA
jgi:hypothetical protein